MTSAHVLNLVGFFMTVGGGLIAIRPDQLTDAEIHEETHPTCSEGADFGEGALKRKRAFGLWGYGLAGIGALVQLAAGMIQ